MTSDDFIPKCMKHGIYFLVLLYWFLGSFSITAGFYVHFCQMQPLQELVSVRFTPAFMLLVLGVVLLINSIIGYIGVLRENICFLRLFVAIQVILFSIYVATCAVALVVVLFPSTVYIGGEGKLRNAVITYHDDDQSAEFIDNIQISIQCCGVDYEGYKDWMLNPYFSCNESNSNAEKCGVPASCCRFDSFEAIDTTCGYGTTNNAIISKLKLSSIIYTQGCLPKVKEVIQNAAGLLCFMAFAIATTLICGIVLSSHTLSILKMEVRQYWINFNRVNNMMYYTPKSVITKIPCQL